MSEGANCSSALVPLPSSPSTDDGDVIVALRHRMLLAPKATDADDAAAAAASVATETAAEEEKRGH